MHRIGGLHRNVFGGAFGFPVSHDCFEERLTGKANWCCRCAFDSRIRATVCYFATDIHSHTLGEGKNDDSLQRVKDIKGELIMVRWTTFIDSLCSTFDKLTIDAQTDSANRSSAKKIPMFLATAAT